MNLALDALPDFTCLPGPGPHLRGAISISPSVDYMERAYDDAKYGRFSRRPYMDIVIPSLTDPSVAPPGKHVMSCFVQYAPYHLTDGTWDDQREAFGDTVIDTIAEYAPNIRNIIRHRQVVTPLDLEREWGLSEGNIFQGELTLEQLFFLRPAPGWAQYRTPVGNLYMCGSATHPGGGIMGAPGRNAAMKILADRTRMTQVVIIGGGHNGLVAAFYLAKAGLKPLVLERSDRIGGGAITTEISPGFHCPTLSHEVLLHDQIVADMELRRHGLGLLVVRAPTSARSRRTVIRSCCGTTTPAPPTALRARRPQDGDAYLTFRDGDRSCGRVTCRRRCRRRRQTSTARARAICGSC